MPTIAERREVFQALHRDGCFAIPNPWDVGSARYLQYLGFRAIATTSAGFAFSRGLADGHVGRDAMLAHIREIVGATEVPVNADFEHGYAHHPSDLAKNVRLCVETGVAGLSIEDSTGRRDQPLYEIDFSRERMQAAREGIGDSNVVLVGRAECFLVGLTDIEEVVRRLTAYADAGADCLYAPGIREREHIKAVVDAVAPRPVNLLIGGAINLSMKDAEVLGVRRVSVGGALARAAWSGFIRAAKKLAEQGTFDEFAEATPYSELQAFFSKAPAGSG